MTEPARSLSRLTTVMQEAVDGDGFRDAAETEWATRGALERIRELEWDVSTLQTTRDEAIAAALMDERKRIRAALLDYATGHSQGATNLMLRALEEIEDRAAF